MTADLAAGMRVVDLGCGDGALLVAAARRGCLCVGYEIDATVAARARSRIAAELSPADAARCTVHCADVGTVSDGELRRAGAVLMFLVPSALALLGPRLRSTLRAGTCVCSYVFPLPDWGPPTEELSAPSPDFIVGSEMTGTVYKYVLAE